MENIEKFLKNNLPDYETALTFEPHQIKIMMFEWGKSQAKEIEQLKDGHTFYQLYIQKREENTKLKEQVEEYKQAYKDELFNNNKLKEQLRESDEPRLLICMECQNKY